MGKPLKYTLKSLQKTIDTYFAATKEGEYTVTGLALVVGGKQLLQNYEKREMFAEIVKLAKLRVENDYEKALRKNGKAGDIFGLKNFGWTDKSELDLNLPKILKVIYDDAKQC